MVQENQPSSLIPRPPRLYSTLQICWLENKVAFDLFPDTFNFATIFRSSNREKREDAKKILKTWCASRFDY